MDELHLSGCALILGASSGFGEAAALELARRGMDIAGVHLDRRATLPNAERIAGAIAGLGRKAWFFNVNAADEDRRRQVLDELAGHTAAAPGPRVRVLLHSLAFGTLRSFVTEPASEGVTKAQMDMTVDVMAHSLVYWVQDLVARGMLGAGSRIYAMTSAGGRRIMPSYGPVSAAKAALESHCRQLACELSPRGIAVNALCAGVTDTPALRKIPGHEGMLDTARAKNPGRRLTTPEDVAAAMAALTVAPAWLTGNVINVDGGEDISG